MKTAEILAFRDNFGPAGFPDRHCKHLRLTQSLDGEYLIAFDCFISSGWDPISDFNLEASSRLRLADAALRLLDDATDDDLLLKVYNRHRGRSDTCEISFPLFVHLLSDSSVARVPPTLRHRNHISACGPNVRLAPLVRDLTAWMHVIGPDATADVLAAELLSGPAVYRRYLKRILGAVWTNRWTKSKTTKRPP